MSNEGVKADGRRLLVEFTCGRCGAIEYTPYVGSPQYDEACNMRNVRVPTGWTNVSGYMPLLCSKCTREHKAFMDPIKKATAARK